MGSISRWTLIKWTFHLCTLFIPLITWWFLVAMFTTSYQDKLKKINGVGGNKLKGILEKFPDEEALKNEKKPRQCRR